MQVTAQPKIWFLCPPRIHCKSRRSQTVCLITRAVRHCLCAYESSIQGAWSPGASSDNFNSPFCHTYPCTEQIGANAHNTKPGRERHGLISIDYRDDMQAWANYHIRIASTPSLDTAPLAPIALGTVYWTVTLNICTWRILIKLKRRSYLPNWHQSMHQILQTTM